MADDSQLPKKPNKYAVLLAESVAEGRVSFPTMSPNVKRTIYAPEIAQILGIPEARAVTACRHARLPLYTNDAFAEQDVLDLRARWDAGKACDVMDLGEVQAELRSSALSARNWLSENGIRPVNQHEKPHLFDRVEVMSRAATATPARWATSGPILSRAEAKSRIAELKAEREAKIAALRVEYEAMIREVMVEAGLV